MALKSFPSLAISNSCFKDDETQTQPPSFSPFCFFTHQVPWLILLVSYCVYAFCSGFDHLSFLPTCSALILATLAFALLRSSSSASDRKAYSQLKTRLSEEEEDEAIEVQSQRETICIQKEESEVKIQVDACDYIDRTCAGEDTECTSPSGADPDPTQDSSDGSISDEESLIEIALPSGYYIDPKKHVQPQLETRCGFQQQNLMELLADISEFIEEENMIEIDISMGSIKCPGFEIKV